MLLAIRGGAEYDGATSRSGVAIGVEADVIGSRRRTRRSQSIGPHLTTAFGGPSHVGFARPVEDDAVQTLGIARRDGRATDVTGDELGDARQRVAEPAAAAVLGDEYVTGVHHRDLLGKQAGQLTDVAFELRWATGEDAGGEPVASQHVRAEAVVARVGRQAATEPERAVDRVVQADELHDHLVGLVENDRRFERVAAAPAPGSAASLRSRRYR